MELEEKSDKAAEPQSRSESEKLHDFDDVLEVVGGYGKYQKILLYGMLAPICILGPYFFSNRIFILSVPNHWCDVPGRPNSTDLETWKNLTIPWEISADGVQGLSKCEMFVGSGENQSTAKCNAWKYDTTNYDRTLPSEFNWVCDKQYYVANAFSITGAGATAGTIVLGIAVDRFGRKSTYFSTVFCFIFFSLASLFVAGNITGFLALQFVLGISTTLLVSSPNMIAMEQMGKEHRAGIYAITGFAFVLGNALLPLSAYLLRSWFLLGLFTPLVSILILLYYKLLPESPRWLLSMGRSDEALKIVEEMAARNGKPIKREEMSRALNAIVARNKESNTKNARIWDLFSRKSLAIRTILLGILSSANGIVFEGVVLNVTNMSGNEFLNYFLVCVMELPVGWLSGYLANRFGRRWTKVVLSLLTALIFLIASIFVGSHPWVGVAAAMSGNLVVAINVTIASLHKTELFPTPLRSTGISLVSTVASIIGFGTPYIIQFGKTHASATYIAFTVVSLVGAMVGPLLPESLGCKLPETVDDAANFGLRHKFWSYLPKNCGGDNV